MLTKVTAILSKSEDLLPFQNILGRVVALVEWHFELIPAHPKLLQELHSN